jgi:ABC-2 type transport system ATP-binding protein
MDAIVADNISKIFRLHEDPSQSIKERIVRMGRSRYRDFVALETLDLTITQGSTVGILGHNGSGKSTLLKCLSGILKPTTGTIQLRGRLASLLELGAGFHPELTGRENVYINAAFLGINRREIDRIFDDIVAFADLAQFIDEPVKHYSSGMYVRLGFAVAVNVDPDILLVDEVLAVGDEVFQRRCLDRIRHFQQEGRTIVVVTHAADLVRQVCDRAIVLHHGKLVADARPGEAIHVFREHLQGTMVEGGPAAPPPSGALRIVGASVSHPHEAERRYIQPGESLEVSVLYESDVDVDSPTLNIAINSADGQIVFALDLDLAAQGVTTLGRAGRITVPFPAVPLLDGTFTIDFGLTDRRNPEHTATRQGRDEFDVLNPTDARGVAALSVGAVRHQGS